MDELKNGQYGCQCQFFHCRKFLNGLHSDASSEDDDYSFAQKNKTGKETGSNERRIENTSTSLLDFILK
jgi:hypothetical protein